MAIAEAHIPIAQENAARKAIQMMAQQGMMLGQEQSVPATEQLYNAENATETAPKHPKRYIEPVSAIKPGISSTGLERPGKIREFLLKPIIQRMQEDNQKENLESVPF